MGKLGKMNSTRSWLVGCGVVGGLVVFVLAVGAVMAVFLIPDANTQMRPSLNPVMVNITLPLDNITQPVNQPVTVYAEAFGDQPIKDLELTINGIPFTQKALPFKGDSNIISSSWGWTPIKEDTYILLARAILPSGEGGISNVVRVNVLPPDQIATPIPDGPTPIITPDLDQLSALMTGIQGGTPAAPPAGFDLQGNPINPQAPVDDPNPEPPQEPGQQPGDNFIHVDAALWLQNIFEKVVVFAKPAAPTQDGGANQCDAILLVQDNSADEAGFFLYRLDPGQPTFSRVATLDGKAGKAAFSYHDPGLAEGKYMFYISSFNAGGESASNIISITIDAPACAAANKPTFEAMSIPIPPGQSLDKAYCYGSASGMPWVRLPYGQNNFILPVNGKFDLAPYWNLIPLPQQPPPQLTLNMECWGWNGSALVFLGTSSQTVNGGIGPTQVPFGFKAIAPPFNLHFAANADECHNYDTDPKYQDIAVVFCNQEIKKGNLILLWDWVPQGDCPPYSDEVCPYDPTQKVDGFRVYSYPPVSPQPITKYIAGSIGESRYTSVKPVYGGGVYFIQDTYFVRALADPTWDESADSNHLGGKKGGFTTILKPKYIREKYLIKEDDEDPYWQLKMLTNEGQDDIGHVYSHQSDPIGWFHTRFWFHAIKEIDFDFEQRAQIKGQVTKAVLRWKKYADMDFMSGSYPCSKLVDFYSGAIPNPLPPLQAGKDYNVTAKVSAWQKSNQFYTLEFVFYPIRTDFAEIPTDSEDKCLDRFNSFELEVISTP